MSLSEYIKRTARPQTTYRMAAPQIQLSSPSLHPVYTIQPVVKPGCTTGLTTSLTTGLTTGCVV